VTTLNKDRMKNIQELSITEIENAAGPNYAAPVTYGFVSGLADDFVLTYLLKHRSNPIARRVFFSEIDKRPGLPFKVIDAAAEELLDAIVARQDRARNEAFLRRLIPRMSQQMRTRTVRTILSSGTKLTRSHVLRWVTPVDAPGISDAVLELALSHRDQDALIGIVYRWPLEYWRDHIDTVFEAAGDWPWLQRQVIFKTGEADHFLRRRAISDPVTELYVRAKYQHPVAADLIIAAAIDVVNQENPKSYENSQRAGLVAWCLGRIGALEEIKRLPLTGGFTVTTDQQLIDRS
jgi:hypothetical protein